MQIYLTKESEKQYQKLPKSEAQRIAKKLLLLGKEPLTGKKLSGIYNTTRSLKTWPYRIIYVIYEKRREIWVISIIHHQGVYK